MKHLFVSSKSDGADTSLVRPSDWNAVHIAGVTAVSSNTTLNNAHDVILTTAGVSGITVTLPTAIGCTGCIYTIKRVDSAAGIVTIATTSSQTIDGATTYTLVNQYQKVCVMSDGSNWQVLHEG